jgi:Ala-tRNA(Pro) deacylase
MTEESQNDAHSRLIKLLNGKGVNYRIATHAPEGRSEDVARVRGSRPEQGAKALVFEVRMPEGQQRFVLAVVPSNQRVASAKIAAQLGGRRARLADPSDAQRITGCVVGTIPPFSFHCDLALLVDSHLLLEPEIAFNAGCLDKSIFITSQSYLEVAKPIVCSIT